MDFLFDPVLRGPLLASIFMGFSTGLVGGLVFLQKRSLLGETLSHSAYPGVVASFLFAPFSPGLAFLSAALFALCSLGLIDLLERKFSVSSDAALCFTLSSFFGFAALLSSRLQGMSAILYKGAQVFLFGQVATMDDGHIYLYSGMAALIFFSILALLPKLKIHYFDPVFSTSVGMPKSLVEGTIRLLLVLAILVGMRGVGVVLLSALLIAPPAAARQWTSRFGPFLALSGAIGALSSGVGSLLSLFIPEWVGDPHLPLATGPMIVVTAALFALFSLVFAPQRGRLSRWRRARAFKLECQLQNLLKALYRGKQPSFSPWIWTRMRGKGYVERDRNQISLTEKGKSEAEKTIHLHRLWEAYLIQMGQRKEVGHLSAEQMEHVLTPELEKELSSLMKEVSS